MIMAFYISIKTISSYGIIYVITIQSVAEIVLIG